MMYLHWLMIKLILYQHWLMIKSMLYFYPNLFQKKTLFLSFCHKNSLAKGRKMLFIQAQSIHVYIDAMYLCV